MNRNIVHPPEKIMGGVETTLLCDSLARMMMGGKEALVIDMSRVRWINSAGLGLLIKTHLQCRDQGRRMILMNPSAKVRSVLAMTRLSGVFEIKFSNGEKE